MIYDTRLECGIIPLSSIIYHLSFIYFAYMFSSSQDLLYIILSLSILWFTVFLCWLLYQAARVLKNANEIIEDLTQKLELIGNAIDFIGKKIEGISSSAGVVSKMMTGLVERFIIGKLSSSLEERAEKKEKKKK